MFRVKLDRNFAMASVLLVAATGLAGCLTEPEPASIHIPQVSKRIMGEAGSLGAHRGQAGSGRDIRAISAVAVFDSVLWDRTDVIQPGGSHTFHLVAAQGGTLNFGRYTLYFPPGAVSGDGDVTISVPDNGVVGCDLSISPPSLNGFSLPVVLAMDCSGTSMSAVGIDSILAKRAHTATVLATAPGLRSRFLVQGVTPAVGDVLLDPAVTPVGIYWEGPEGWVNKGAMMDPAAWMLKLNLQHFSNYRAGW